MSNANKRRNRRGRSRTPYIILAVVVILALVVGGYYAYSSSTTTQTAQGCPSVTQTSGSSVVYACIKTNLGSMEIELYPNAAPQTVANFVSLAKSGFYNNLVWHRIVPGFVIQTGDPNTRNGGGNRAAWGTGGSSQTVPLEIDPVLHNTAGFIGMARSASKNSGSSQFYINLGPNTSLDGNYTVFGQVVSGMNVAYALGNVPTYTNQNGQYYQQPIDPSQAMVVSITIVSGD